MTHKITDKQTTEKITTQHEKKKKKKLPGRMVLPVFDMLIFLFIGTPSKCQEGTLGRG